MHIHQTTILHAAIFRLFTHGSYPRLSLDYQRYQHKYESANSFIHCHVNHETNTDDKFRALIERWKFPLHELNRKVAFTLVTCCRGRATSFQHVETSVRQTFNTLISKCWQCKRGQTLITQLHDMFIVITSAVSAAEVRLILKRWRSA